MAKYKVCYTGFALVEAESEEEAEEMYWNDNFYYSDESVDLVVEVDE